MQCVTLVSTRCLLICHPCSLAPAPPPGDDFLESLLGGGSGGGTGGSEGASSAPASPLWSPSASDSGVSDSHPWDPLDSPCRPPASPSFFGASCAQPLPRQTGTGAPDVTVDLGERGIPGVVYLWQWLMTCEAVIELKLAYPTKVYYY
ncbi:hypothetical protein NHX12_004209 [Muraenolepis orangiensis]|uniref:Uncharacterized protein n=1 Tax=Muraenolepis orangiensis TaxID=630683 RepID=A0A9Q0DSE6_9TELE|nr:hypothetical protein NHX12_004209 [Muraenolepis orangiensis]